MTASPPKNIGVAGVAKYTRYTLPHHHLPPIGGGVCGVASISYQVRWGK